MFALSNGVATFFVGDAICDMLFFEFFCKLLLIIVGCVSGCANSATDGVRVIKLEGLLKVVFSLAGS